jgi:hypothetical protein
MDEYFLGVASAPAGSGPVLTTVVILAGDPARSKGTARVADQPAAWLRRPAAPDDEPTWEDAEWQ